MLINIERINIKIDKEINQKIDQIVDKGIIGINLKKDIEIIVNQKIDIEINKEKEIDIEINIQKNIRIKKIGVINIDQDLEVEWINY